MKNTVLAFVFASVLLACSSGNESHTENSTQQPNSDTLIGQVTNSHGIRDDVYAYIEKNYVANPERQTAALLVGRKNQEILEIVNEKRAVTQEIITKHGLAAECLAKEVDAATFQREYSELAARTFNTPERLRSLATFEKSATGLVLGGPLVSDACEAAK